MSPTKNNSNKNEIENISLSPKPIPNRSKFKNNVISSNSKWKILAQAIRKSANVSASTSKEDDNNDLNQEKAILRYPSYDLIQCKRTCTNAHDPSFADRSRQKHDNSDRSEECRRIWYHIVAKEYDEISLKISGIRPNFSVDEINGFNNTGNVCIWPSEECLSIYCLENRELFHGKSVIEIGAGMTGLAGLIVSQACCSQSVTLTDGNEVSVKNLAAIVKENKLEAHVTSHILKWEDTDKYEKMAAKYDIAICSDCLFFDQGRAQLVNCLAKILKPSTGLAIVIAPKRSGTLDNFVDLINKETNHFHPVKQNYQYSERIWRRRQHLFTDENTVFKEDKDYPVMLICKRK